MNTKSFRPNKSSYMYINIPFVMDGNILPNSRIKSTILVKRKCGKILYRQSEYLLAYSMNTR